MHAEEIRAQIRKHPFEPFRLCVSDGSRYEVLHYDFVIVSPRRVTVAIGAPSPDDFPDELVDIDPIHITRIEPIKAASKTNGRRAPRTRRK